MATPSHRRIDRIKRRVLALGSHVELALHDAIFAVEERQIDIAESTIRGDAEIDRLEIELEELCLETLALEHPVAFELRFVFAVLKINNDLERIGDLAGNIAEQAIFLAQRERLPRQPLDLASMEGQVQAMLKQVLDALVHVDTDLAQLVAQADDRVDRLLAGMFTRVETEIQNQPQHLEQLVHLLQVARMLERIGDHTVNIAQDVVYLGRSEIRRGGSLV